MFALLISWLRSINDPKIPNLFGRNFCLHELQLLSSDTNSKPSSDASNTLQEYDIVLVVNCLLQLLRIYPLTLTVLYTVKFILSMTNMWWRLKRRWIQMLTLLRWCLYTSIKDDALHQAVKDLHSRLLKAIKWTFLDALFIC